MLNEDAYRSAREETNRHMCSFEKAILRRCCSCENAEKHNIADRETVSCKTAIARENCYTLRELLHQSALFTLKLTHIKEPLPYAKEMKIQCGGMLGLQQLLTPDTDNQSTVSNIHGLILAAKEKFGSLQELPYSEIIKSVAAFEARRKH